MFLNPSQSGSQTLAGSNSQDPPTHFLKTLELAWFQLGSQAFWETVVPPLVCLSSLRRDISASPTHQRHFLVTRMHHSQCPPWPRSDVLTSCPGATAASQWALKLAQFRHRLFVVIQLRILFEGYLAHKPKPNLEFSRLCPSLLCFCIVGSLFLLQNILGVCFACPIQFWKLGSVFQNICRMPPPLLAYNVIPPQSHHLHKTLTTIL